LGVVLAVAAAGLCVRLGIWQLARLKQRRARNAVVLAARARPPVELSGGVAADSLLARRVHAHGVYDFEHERLWRPKAFADQPGVDFVTPLKLADGGGVLVDRGWAPSPDAYHVDALLYREADTADVTGLALAAPRGRGDVNPSALRDSLGYALLPFIVQQLPETGGVVPRGAPRRWPAALLDDGPHLSYAIQWFSFALIIVVGSIALLRKRVPLG
jgi:surfeit locus 1 family protein